MDGRAPAPAKAGGAEVTRCPECGAGELYPIEVTRRDGGVWRGAYCAGLYDHERRRILARSCGYAGSRAPDPPVAAPAVGAPAAGLARLTA